MAKTFARIVGAAALLGLGGLAGWGFGQWQGRHAPAAGDTAVATAGERKVLYWYDPMVPTQRFDKPGKSPFMDMQLVPRYADEGEASTGASGTLAISTQAQQALGLRLAVVEQRRLGAAVEAVGTVQLNERDIAIVQARTAGFVERVFGRAPGDVVAAGAPLAELFNPEWLGAQQEYLAVRATGDAALAQAAKQRLLLLGMPAPLVERVEASGQPLALQTDRHASRRCHQRADGAPGHGGGARHDAGAHQRPGHGVARSGAARAAGRGGPARPAGSGALCGPARRDDQGQGGRRAAGGQPRHAHAATAHRAAEPRPASEGGHVRAGQPGWRAARDAGGTG